MPTGKPEARAGPFFFAVRGRCVTILPMSDATFPMRGTWRIALAALPIGAGMVALAAGAELLGLVAFGALLGNAEPTECIVALVFGVLVQPFGWTALAHARLTMTAHELQWLGFGFLCKTERLPWHAIARWGWGKVTNRGRSECILLLATRDGAVRSIKLAMYRGQDEALARLQARLGAPAAVRSGLAGLSFADEPPASTG